MALARLRVVLGFAERDLEFMRTNRNNSANIYQVAKAAKVSTATVSAVVNNQNVVEARTRKRVLEAIKQLHYQPNLYASNLARGRLHLLGLIVSDIVNPFFGELAHVIQQEALARGYEVLLATTDFSNKRLVASLKQMIGMRVAGIAVMTSEMQPHVIEMLRSHNAPAVFEDVGAADRHISNLRIDYEGGILKAVRYLVDLGHRKILFVKTYPAGDQRGINLLSIRRRSEAFQSVTKSFKALGVSPQIVSCAGPGPVAGLGAIRKALSESRFTAVVAIADPPALGILRGLREAGLSIPLDVSVVGFDNSYLCEYLTPPLTSVNIPRGQVGRLVVETLLRMIENNDAGRELQVETELIVRESTAPPPNRHGGKASRYSRR